MRLVTAKIKSDAPYSPSRAFQSERGPSETHEAFDRRCYKEHALTDANGTILIPGVAFKKALHEAAKFLGRKIPGKRGATWTKHFQSGILVLNDVSTGVNVDDADAVDVYCHSDGKPGGNSGRVWRRFPAVNQWSAEVRFAVIDDTITNDEFEFTLEKAGLLIGVGRWRPANGGMNGRFVVESVKWDDESALKRAG